MVVVEYEVRVDRISVDEIAITEEGLLRCFWSHKGRRQLRHFAESRLRSDEGLTSLSAKYIWDHQKNDFQIRYFNEKRD